MLLSFLSLYRQFGVLAAHARPVNSHANIRTDNGDSARKACNGTEKVPKQDDYAVAFYQEADKGPFH